MVAIGNHGSRRPQHVVPSCRYHGLQAIEHTVQAKTQHDDDDQGMHVGTFMDKKRHDQAEKQALENQVVIIGIVRIACITQRKNQRRMQEEQQIQPGDTVRLVVLPRHAANRDQQQRDDGKKKIDQGFRVAYGF